VSLCDQLVRGHVAGSESRRIADGEPDFLVFSHLHVFEGFLVIPGRRSEFEHVELLADCRLELFVAGVEIGGHKKAIEVILDDHLPVVGIRFATELGCDLLGPLLVLIGDRLDGELPGLAGGFQEKVTVSAQAEYARCQHLFCHRPRWA
jgi:hypothetical protein